MKAITILLRCNIAAVFQRMLKVQAFSIVLKPEYTAEAVKVLLHSVKILMLSVHVCAESR